jgi:preprotein translocase subunit SecB
MADFPVNLKQVYFTRTMVIANPSHVPNDNLQVTIAPHNTINVQKLEDVNDEYVVTMKMLFNPENDNASAYSIDMECVALFQVVGIEGDEALRAVTIVGHGVVYGAIRESVLWITGRHPFGPLSLGLSVLGQKTAEAKEET